MKNDKKKKTFIYFFCKANLGLIKRTFLELEHSQNIEIIEYLDHGKRNGRN